MRIEPISISASKIKTKSLSKAKFSTPPEQESSENISFRGKTLKRIGISLIGILAAISSALSIKKGISNSNNNDEKDFDDKMWKDITFGG